MRVESCIAEVALAAAARVVAVVLVGASTAAVLDLHRVFVLVGGAV